MNYINFELSDPYIEKWNFEVCIDRINSMEQKIDSKFIIIDKTFCLFDLPKLGIKNTERIISENNFEAKEWLKLYTNKILNKYSSNWDEQPEKLLLICGRNYPSIGELKLVG